MHWDVFFGIVLTMSEHFSGNDMQWHNIALYYIMQSITNGI